MRRRETAGGRIPALALAAALAACLIPPAAGAQEAAPGLPGILHMCDPGKWTVARYSRPSLLAATGAGKEAVLVCTGGALTSYGAPPDSQPACARGMLDAAGFDVVNLAHRDLVGEPGKLAGAIKGGRAALVSASFRMPPGTPTPWKQVAVVSRGTRKVAFIGLAQRSAAMALPGSGAIKGLVYVEPQEALKGPLAKARGADAIVVLADAALPDAAKWLGAHKQIAAVIVSGRGGVPLAAETIDRLWLSPPGGTALGLLTRDAGKATNKIMPLPEPKQINPAYRQVTRRFALELAVPAVAEIAVPSPAAAAIKAGQTIPLTAHGQNRAVSLAVRSVAMLNSFGGQEPPPGRRFLVIDTRWQNVLAPQVVSRKIPLAYKVRSLADHLHCVADAARVLPPARVRGAAGVLGTGLSLPRRGSEARGRLVFEIPADTPPKRLALRFYDFAHGHIFLPLLGAPKGAAAPPSRPILPLRKNQIVELGVYAFTKSKTLGGQKAPSGMTFIALDVRGQSLHATEADATAFDPKAKPGAKVRLGTVADWKDWRKHMQLVADAEYAYLPGPFTSLPEQPRLLPDVMTGGRVVFLAPEKAASLELACYFPKAAVPGKGVIRPAAITFALEGKRPGLAERPAIASVDDVLAVSVVGQGVTRRFAGAAAGRDEMFLVLDVTVANRLKKGEWLQTKAQLQYLSQGGEKSERDELSLAGLRPAADLMWIPPGERRSFQVVFRIAVRERKPRLAYRGYTKAATLNLKPIDKVPPPVAPAGLDKPKIEPERPSAEPPKPGKPKPEAPRPEKPTPTTAPAARPDLAKIGPVKVGDIQVFYPKLKPKGLGGVGLKADDVNRAIEKGRKFLWDYLWEKELDKGEDELEDGEHLLAALALVHSGAHKAYPNFEAHLRVFLKRKTLISDREDNYEFGMLSMLAASYGDPAFYHRLRQAARYIVESQGPGGTWYYQAQKDTEIKRLVERAAETGVLKVYGGRALDAAGPKAALKRTMKLAKEVAYDGDNSVTQFAVLGLWTASRCGLGVPGDVWKRCLGLTRKRQNRDGGWDYRGRGNSSYGSMTCAGVCTAAICMHHLGTPPLKDPCVHKGLAWLTKNWTLKDNPGNEGNYHYYYLYSIERVGRILDIDFVGRNEWYPLGAKYLLANQKADGSWAESGNDNVVRPTSFALLFLTKATATLKPPARRGGTGLLRASVRLAPGERFYFILDASRSMNALMKGKSKFDIAREAIWTLANQLPVNAQLALRVYGHRKDHTQAGTDDDTALEIEMDKLDKDALRKKLLSLRARGKTPLALSCEQAIEDLGDVSASEEKPVTVVLLTDGGENTARRRNPVKSAAGFAKLKGVRFHIVGFDIGRADWTRQLKQMASGGGGRYWPANKAETLQRELRAAVFQVPETFAVLDAAGKQVAKGRFGQTVKLKEGKYIFKTSFVGKNFRQPFWINTDETTGVVFDAAALDKPKKRKD